MCCPEKSENWIKKNWLMHCIFGICMNNKDFRTWILGSNWDGVNVWTRWNRWWYTRSRNELPKSIPTKFVSENPYFCYMCYLYANEWFWSAMIPICELWIFEKWYELSHMSILTLWIIDIEFYMMKYVRSLISKWYVIDVWKLYMSHMI